MVKRVRYFLLSGFLVLGCAALGQTNRVDSLQAILADLPDTKQKVETLHQLFDLTNDQDLQQALRYAREGLQIGKAINDPHAKAMAYTDLGYIEFLQQNLSEAIRLYQRALSETKENASNDYPFVTYTQILNYYRDIGRLDSAYLFDKQAQPLLNKATPKAQAFYHQSKGWLEYQNSRYRSAIDHAEQKIKVSSSKNSIANLLKALSHLELQEYDQAKESVDLAFQVFANDKDTLSSRIYVLLVIAKGDLNMATSNYSAAIDLYEKAYKLSIDNKFPRIQARVASHLGHVFESLGNYTKAIELYEEALNIHKLYLAKQDLARLNARIGWALVYSNNTILSSQFAERSLNEMRLVGDQAGMAFGWNLLGYINFLHKDLATAMVYYDSALRVRKSLDSPADYYKTLFNVAEVHAQHGEYERALINLRAVLSQEENNSKDVNNLIFTYNTISRMYFNLGNQPEAEKYALLAYKTSKQNNLFPQLKTSLQNILDYGINSNSAINVTRYYNELKVVTDTLSSLEQNNRILQISALRELEARQNELNVLRTQAKLEALEAEKKNQALSLYFYLVLLLIFILLLLVYILFMRKQNQKKLMLVNKELESKVLERTKQLTTAYHELETYFYKSHHDMRGPVTTLLGLVSLSKLTHDKTEMDKIWVHVERTVQQQLSLIEKINQLDQVISLKFNTQLISLAEEINLLLDKKRSTINIDNIKISYRLQTDKIKTSQFLLRVILENLFDNAIAFSNGQNPAITFESESKEGVTCIIVVDNGEGIRDDFKDSVFTMFFRGSTISDGSGLGLYTVKKAVEKLGGSISFESTPFERTAFKLQLANG
jgi:signal transduction histidine kinase